MPVLVPSEIFQIALLPSLTRGKRRATLWKDLTILIAYQNSQRADGAICSSPNQPLLRQRMSWAET